MSTHTRTALGLLTAVATLAIAAGLASCSSTKAAAETPAYLFVFDGFDATMTPVAGATDTYSFAADLNCADLAECSPVAWFTDRPVRDSGTLDLTTFVGLWNDPTNDGFRTDPPNVAIEVPARDTESGEPETIIAEMSAPRLAARAGGEYWITATMTIIPAEQLDDPAMATSHLGAHTDTVRADVPAIVGDVTVFVDDAGAWSNGSGASGDGITKPTLPSGKASDVSGGKESAAAAMTTITRAASTTRSTSTTTVGSSSTTRSSTTTAPIATIPDPKDSSDPGALMN